MDLTLLQIIPAAGYSNFFLIEHFAQDWTLLANLTHHPLNVFLGGFLNKIFVGGVARLNLFGNGRNRGLDPIEQAGEMPEFDIVDSAFDGAAIGMAEHDD